MNRVNEYRGKAINRKNTWFYGDLRHGKNGEVWIYPLDEEPGIDKHRVDPATVGQWTTLHCTKTKAKIWEGDSCKCYVIQPAYPDREVEVEGLVFMCELDGTWLITKHGPNYRLDGVYELELLEAE